jgi:branched-chain amino acid transport system ATP-binding protein
MRGAMARARRTITTLIGGNGAGKSTLLRAIHGSCRSFSGRIVFAGEAVEGLQPWQRPTRGVGLVPQGRCDFPCMTVAENLKMGCRTAASARHKPAIKWRVRAGNLSVGEQQVLEMATVLVAPSPLLLDEPSLGLSPKMQGDPFATIEKVAAHRCHGPRRAERAWPC